MRLWAATVTSFHRYYRIVRVHFVGLTAHHDESALLSDVFHAHPAVKKRVTMWKKWETVDNQINDIDDRLYQETLDSRIRKLSALIPSSPHAILATKDVPLSITPPVANGNESSPKRTRRQKRLRDDSDIADTVTDTTNEEAADDAAICALSIVSPPALPPNNGASPPRTDNVRFFVDTDRDHLAQMSDIALSELRINLHDAVAAIQCELSRRSMPDTFDSVNLSEFDIDGDMMIAHQRQQKNTDSLLDESEPFFDHSDWTTSIVDFDVD